MVHRASAFAAVISVPLSVHRGGRLVPEHLVEPGTGIRDTPCGGGGGSGGGCPC